MTFKHRSGIVAATIAAASAGILFAQSDNKTVATAQRELLVQSSSSWNGKAYTTYPAGQPQLTMLKITIPAHSVLPWHTHPFPNAAYVLSGTLTVHDRASGKTKVFHQGEAFAESVDDVHRGEAGEEPVELVITYAGTPGVPTSTPVKGEKPEY